MKVYIGPYKKWVSINLPNRFEKLENFLQSVVNVLWNNRRKVKVRIDRYDTFSADNTLSYIVVPLLEQLKNDKNGACYVDDSDVPEEIQSTSANPKNADHDLDEFHFTRWDYVLDEMIWAMIQIRDDEPDAPEYPKYFGNLNFNRDMTGEEQKEYDEWNPIRLEYEERISNGCRLFGKYFRALWC